MKRLLFAPMLAAALTTTSAHAQTIPEFPIPAGFESEFAEIDGISLHHVKGGSVTGSIWSMASAKAAGIEFLTR